MGIENRRQHRISVALDVRVRGKDRYGRSFEESSVSDNVSRGGCSFQISHELELGLELEIEIHRRVPGRAGAVPFLTQGVVLRVAQDEFDRYTVGVQFTGPQFPTYSSESAVAGGG